MKSMNEVRERFDRTLESFRTWPLLRHVLVLAVTLVLYATGLLLVDVAAGDARMPVVLVAVFFLPAVARAWMMVYWQVREDLKGRFPFDRRHPQV